ncbi:MAG: Gfo/Idh/MocA family oxidoreductase [Bacteroidales bacterium]|nr:Gfo/Idh/MocA family oxidoreductase [Bacteroidales bacterium]
MSTFTIGFLGAGGIARSHAFALSALKFYYPDAPEITLADVHSARPESREAFAHKYGFARAVDLPAFIQNSAIDTVFILGPNHIHYPHLEAALKMPSVKRIYLEKPVCSNVQEEEAMKQLMMEYVNEKKVQVGFQMTQTSAIQEALNMWYSGRFGQPIHFNFTLKHGDYLQKTYREKRATRLTPAPDGGAMADLGSHAVSLAMAFLGENLKISHALQAGAFDDVPAGSDLYSEISVVETTSKAVGTISGSRVSAGTGDLLAFEIYAEKGAIKYTSHQPDTLEYYLEETDNWTKVFTGSNYQPATSFPSAHVPGGWLRSLIHAHYVFLTGYPQSAFVPDLKHGLAVQRIVRETADFMERFRQS